MDKIRCTKKRSKKFLMCDRCNLLEIHDKVFQTVYASGLVLLSIRRSTPCNQFGGQLDSVIEGLNEAIRELRQGNSRVNPQVTERRPED